MELNIEAIKDISELLTDESMLQFKGGAIGLTSVILGRKLIKKINSKKETQES